MSPEQNLDFVGKVRKSVFISKEERKLGGPLGGYCKSLGERRKLKLGC